MMRILHTSDWHLGHVLYGHDRQDEQSAMLRQLVDVVRQAEPHALLVAGDIYHYSSPAAQTQRMYTEGLLAIRRACPTMPIIVMAGNHDSPSRLEVDSSLWHCLGVRVIGRIERTAEGAVDWSRHIVAVRNSDGQAVGYVVAVPHVYPQNFPALTDDSPRQERQARFFQALLDEVHRQNIDGLPVVLAAHLAVSGSSSRGHDEGVGGMDWVPLSDLGQGYDYLALGHIHCPQDVPGSNGRARYCGTPLAVSFDEDYPHEVSIVDVDCGKQPCIHTVALRPLRPLRTIPAQPLPWAEALSALAGYPADAPDYIRLQVLTEGSYLPGDCMEQARAAIGGKQCRLCLIKPVRKPAEPGAQDPAPGLSLEEFRQATPLEIARRYYLEREGEPMSDELVEMMREAMKRAKANE